MALAVCWHGWYSKFSALTHWNGLFVSPASVAFPHLPDSSSIFPSVQVGNPNSAHLASTDFDPVVLTPNGGHSTCSAGSRLKHCGSAPSMGRKSAARETRNKGEFAHWTPRFRDARCTTYANRKSCRRRIGMKRAHQPPKSRKGKRQTRCWKTNRKRWRKQKRRGKTFGSIIITRSAYKERDVWLDRIIAQTRQNERKSKRNYSFQPQKMDWRQFWFIRKRTANTGLSLFSTINRLIVTGCVCVCSNRIAAAYRSVADIWMACKQPSICSRTSRHLINNCRFWTLI